jgi:hypothetical protein
MMEALSSSVMSVLTRATRRNILEDAVLIIQHFLHSEFLKGFISNAWLHYNLQGRSHAKTRLRLQLHCISGLCITLGLKYRSVSSNNNKPIWSSLISACRTIYTSICKLKIPIDFNELFSDKMYQRQKCHYKIRCNLLIVGMTNISDISVGNWNICFLFNSHVILLFDIIVCNV